MTYFHLECGEEGRPLKILGCFTAGRGPRLFNQASPLSGVKSRRQEMTTRAGLQPFSWAIVALAPSWALTQGPSPVLRPTERHVPTAPDYRREAKLRAAPGMSVCPGPLLWPCCVPTQPSEDTLSHSTPLQGQFQEISPCVQRDSSR